ncbi:Enoyl-CoA hydratase/isomerase [Pseudonocardia thermophila]|uniref:Enoyl-CoA hydratase/isomerase n=1 Tax=Pseudonocardia thermophila TaxID=1848 RepID=A0A1M6PL27_PSETH|nr:Enoyl-CoA hydratase/isomerase [Pseudonocardia thermophila]
MVRTTPAGLLAAAAEPLFGPGGVPVDPLVVVDLDGPVDAAGLAAAVAATPRLVVGTSGGVPAPDVVEALDLTLVTGPERHRATVAVADLEAAVDALVAAVVQNPQAALVLARLLRWSSMLPVPDALDAESLAYSTLLGGPEFRRWLTARGPRPLPPDVPDPVLLARDGAVLRITLNRPQRRNAYGRQLRDALVDGLRVAELDPTITRVVVDGAGPCFCSGGDLDEFGTTPDLVTAHLIRTHGGAALPLHRLADRAEVRVHGTCVGAGVELPSFARRVVAAPGTTFRLPELAMGLVPGAGGTVSITRRIGRWRCLYLALSGTALDVERALAWGLVDEIS